MSDLWLSLAARANVALSQDQIDNLSSYLDRLERGNDVMNLTRIVDRSSAEVQHIGDALTLLPFLSAGPLVLADIGSGGGVPGIPLAIVRPDIAFTLIESTKKKALFLKDTAIALGLNNVTVLGDRAEDAGRSPLRGTCDIVTARGVASLDWLVEWCVPLLKKNGSMLAMKGERAAAEVIDAKPAIHLLNASLVAVHKVELPGSDHKVIVQIKRIGSTHDVHPAARDDREGEPAAVRNFLCRSSSRSSKFLSFCSCLASAAVFFAGPETTEIKARWDLFKYRDQLLCMEGGQLHSIPDRYFAQGLGSFRS